MGLLSFLSRKGTAAAPSPSEAAEPVQEARTQARRRLVGAIVLVGIGIVGFPLVFETQPRPIPVDIRVDIPKKEGAAPLPMPPVARATPSRPAASPVREDIVTEDRSDAGREVAPPASAAGPASKPADKPAPKPSEKPAEKAVEKPVAKPAESDRAKALLEGKDKPAAKAAEPGRFVLQVGAFADVTAAREVRAKVEKAGLKTYTQVVETPQGKRIRVRVGPFESREEAQKALAKAASAGLKSAVLTL